VKTFDMASTPNGYINPRSDFSLTVSRLSKLQRWMIARAQENRMGSEPLNADLLTCEVLAGFYLFDLQPSSKSNHWNTRPRQWLTWYGAKFKRDAIGHARYNAACAAVSRAARRLIERGLMEYSNQGFNLTESGAALLLEPGKVAPQHPYTQSEGIA
jgi:hypothetical protein